MLVLIGILSALWDTERSGRGQVIDAAMVDSASLLAQRIWAMLGDGRWKDERGSNLLEGHAPFYDTYTCADGRYVAGGAIEPQFYSQLLAGLGLDQREWPEQFDQSGWGETTALFSGVFAARTRDEWVRTFADTDACVTPVLTLTEVADHPHMAARATMVAPDGFTQAAPAPRFSRTAPRSPWEPRQRKTRSRRCRLVMTMPDAVSMSSLGGGCGGAFESLEHPVVQAADPLIELAYRDLDVPGEDLPEDAIAHVGRCGHDVRCDTVDVRSQVTMSVVVLDGLERLLEERDDR